MTLNEPWSDSGPGHHMTGHVDVLEGHVSEGPVGRGLDGEQDRIINERLIFWNVDGPTSNLVINDV